MKAVLTFLYNAIVTLNPTVKAILGLGSLAMALSHYINSMWAELFARVDAIAAGSMGSADFSPLGIVNYVFPLDALLTFLSAYMVLVGTCAAIRIVKSFIPTIA